MSPYLELLQKCREDGIRQKNRTGVDTFMIPGGTMEFNCSSSFPIVTTKKVAFNQVKGELCGFIRGYTSAADFRALGCTIWDANANDPNGNGGKWLKSPYRTGTDDLGRIYGAQWRKWRFASPIPSAERSHYEGSHQVGQLDQLAKVLDMIILDPTSRRIIVNAWQPGELDQMALPPCHLMFQLLLEQDTRLLHMCMYQRSCDMFLGVPFNISSYALLLCLIAKATGCVPGKLNMFLADVHIYENHLAQVDEQLSRAPKQLPRLIVDYDEEMRQTSTPLQFMEDVGPEHISLFGYEPHPPIRAPMAV